MTNAFGSRRIAPHPKREDAAALRTAAAAPAGVKKISARFDTATNRILTRRALFEAVQFDEGEILNPRLSQYRVPRFSDVPETEVVLLDRKDLPSAGAGETPIVCVAPAVAGAEELLLLALAAAPAAAAAAAAAADAPVTIAHERFTLPNGLTVLVHEDRKAPIVAVNLWYHVGAKDEPRGKTGFAHLFEHLMFNGSENHNDEFFRPLEPAGATKMNGTTWYDRTNYFQNVPTSALDVVLWMESDRMGHLLGAIDQATLDEQRGVVQNEKRQGENEPYGKTWITIAENTFPKGHPYSWSVIGSMEDLDAASLDDVKEWFRTYYGPSNATIVLAGDIDVPTAREKVQRYFGDIPARAVPERPSFAEPWPTQERRATAYDRLAPTPAVAMAWRVPDPADLATYLPYVVLAEVLTDGDASRLRAQVAEDRLAQRITEDAPAEGQGADAEGSVRQDGEIDERHLARILDEARQIVTTYTKIPASVLDQVILPKWPTEPNRPSIEALMKLGEEDGLFKKTPDLDALLP